MKRAQMKQAVVLTVIVGLLGVGVLQAGHKCRRGRYHTGGYSTSTVAVASPTPMAQANSGSSDSGTYRSFSYEPGSNQVSTTPYYAPARTYRSTNNSSTPTYFLPNIDPRKHTGSR